MTSLIIAIIHICDMQILVANKTRSLSIVMHKYNCLKLRDAFPS